MNFIKNPYFLGGAISVYFLVAWFFPWELFQNDSTISISYLWDGLFALVLGLIYRLPLKPQERRINLAGSVSRIIATVALAALSLLFIQMSATAAPFRFLERPILQLLILAPFLEEFVFRYAALGAALSVLRSKNKAMLLGAFLFSLSHLPGIWHLPEEFRAFILIQLAYTFALGWIISKSRVRTGGVLEPIILHFLFNLCFYIGVMKGWI